MVIIIIGLMTILQIMLLCSVLKRIPTVLAGGSDHFAFRHEIGMRNNFTFKCEGEYIDKNDYDVYAVKGHSMSKCNIFDGQKVLVAKHEDVSCIEGNPAIVLKLNHSVFFKSQHAIRRHISYLNDFDEDNIGRVFDNNKTLIRVSRDKFIRGVMDSLCKMKDTTSRCVITETFDVNRGCFKYSAHHLSNVVGVVRYSF